MMVLDTDHISILDHEDSPQAVALTKQLEALPKDEVATTAVRSKSKPAVGLP